MITSVFETQLKLLNKRVLENQNTGPYACECYFALGISQRYTKYALVHTLKRLTVCSYHVTYAFYSESTHCSRLNVIEILAQNSCNIWSLTDFNGNRTHNNLVLKRTPTIKPNWPVGLNGRVFVYELSGCGYESHCSDQKL